MACGNKNKSILRSDRMENLSAFGFENEDIKGGMFEKYKGKKGQVDRGAIVFTDPKAMFVGAKIHFKERFFYCKKGLCCEKLGAPKYRIGSVLVKYATDKLGNLKQPFSYELLPWIFSDGAFIKLKTINAEFPLATHDIKIACDNEDYQHLNITPCSEVIWQTRTKEEVESGRESALKKKILDEAKPIWDYIKKCIASDLSVEEIRDLLSGNTGTGTDPTQKLDLNQILTSI
jgi:hypothetical protein